MSVRRRTAPVPTREFRTFVGIVRRLRRECPWDRKQTHRSLRESLLEETYEVLDTLGSRDRKGLALELGDLLLHVAMHATIAEEQREFTFAQVLSGISDKLVRRHPHIYGTAAAPDAGTVVRNWEQIKMNEGRRSVLEGIPRHLPALQQAAQVQRRASAVGFDWKTSEGVLKKVAEEAREVRGARTRRRREEEFGDLLFSLVNLARFTGVKPEHALRGAVARFTRRFRYVERGLAARGIRTGEATLAQMDALWEEAKRKRRRRR
ncbi:MAG TPA: nucleoside triphosphate pyrophosphohydrolase [Bacteroidota bacterium]|nr:nucleoside triphosphate pyrophosphohydrolase [Bacteroidota bacterium]